VGGGGGIGGGIGIGEGWFGARWGREKWDELGMRSVVEVEKKKEVPPGMAVSVPSRPSSKPSNCIEA
jgi:hypothetical protein